VWRLPKGMIKASDEELEKSRESCESWAWFGGGLVFFGVAATVAIAAIHPKYDSWLEQWGSAVADGLVAVGVAIEIKFGQMAGLRQNELRRRSDDIAAEANARAAEAHQKASEATERAETAALELQRFRAQRVFHPISQLNKHAGTRFDTAMPIDELEPGVLAGLIELALHASGWVQLDWSGTAAIVLTNRGGRPIAGISTVRNVLIIVHPDSPELMPAAQELCSMLTMQGIEAIAQTGGGPRNHNQNAIHILVGRRA
jgi:hypothetical protein